MTGRLEGKVAVVTGSTSGIGEATARRFREEGAKVVISGRNRDKGARIAAELGAGAAFCAADVAKEDDVAALIAFAVDRFGRLDVLFNNAGADTEFGGIETITAAGFRFDMDVLVGGVLYGMKHAMPHMRRQKSGSIINNASIAGHRHGYAPHVYNAAKAAVAQLTRSVALEVAEHGVRVNAVSPGLIVTPIFLNAARKDPAKETQNLRVLADQFAQSQPLPTPGMPIDIANAVLFLASDEARFVTAHDLVVDGGMIAGRTNADRQAWWDRVNAAFDAAGP